MAESEFKIKVGVDINPAGIQKQLNSIKGNKLKIDIDTTAANNKINALKKNIESLAKIQVKIGGFGVASTGNLNSSNGYAKEIKNASAAFKELQAIQRQIKANMYSISLFDADKDKTEIKELEATIESLMSEYNKLYNIKNKALKPIEKAALDRDFNAEISGTKQVTEAYKHLAKASREIGKMKIKIAGLDGVTDANQIETYKRQLEELEATYNKLKASLVQNMSETQFDKLSADVTDTMNKLDQLNARLLDAKTKAANKISSDIGVGDFDNDISKLEYSYRRINNANEDLINSMERLRNASENLNISNNDFLNADNEEDRLVAMDKLISAEKEFADAKRVTKNQIDDNTRSQKEQEEVARATAKSMKELTAQQKLRADADKLSSKMDLWLHDNSAAAADFGDSIHSLQNELKKCDAVRFQGIKNEFDQITTKARILGKTGLNFTDRLKMQFTRLSSYFSVATLMMAAMQKGREAFQNVLEVDTALTGLYRVTDLTTSQYDSLYDGMTASAKEYGVVLTDLINATADWSRAGFAPDVASELAEVTAIYQHISDLDYDTASENLLTAYKGFEDDLNKTFSGDSVAAVGYIGDILNELDNEFAVTAAGLGEGIKRSASALQVAGNTIQETAAMIGGITEVTQDPEKAGNALKVVSMRLRGMKGELQELGEETDENVENLSKMQGDILNLTHGKVNIFDAGGEFKSTYDILDSVADVWDRLSTIEQADLLETMAGKHRANDLAAILSNWENVEAMYESAMGAEGSAAREHEKYVKSMQGRLDSLSSSWQSLSNTILGSDFLGGIISGFGGALDAIDAFIDKFGLFPTLLTTASSVMSVKGKGFFRLIEDESTTSGYRVGTMFGNSIWKSLSNIGHKIGGLFRGEFGKNLTSSAFKFDDGIVQQLKSDTQALNDLRMALGNTNVLFPEAVADSMQNASDATKKWAEDINLANMSNEKALQVINERQDSLQSLAVAQQAQNKSLSSSRKLLAEYNSGMKTTGMSQQAFVDAVNKGNPAMGKYLSNVNIGKASMSGYIVSLVGAKVATIALEAATMALNMAMTMGIGLIIQGAITAIDSWIHAEEKLAESVDEATSSYKQQHEELTKGKSAFDEAAKSYERLNNGVSKLNGENISLTPDEYDEYINAANTIADMVPSLVAGYDEQGNAILNCAGDIDTLTDAYNKLIVAENNKLLNGDGEDYKGISDISDDLDNFYDIEKKELKGWSDGLTSIFNSNDLSVDSIIDNLGDKDLSGAVARIRKELKEANKELEGVEEPGFFASQEDVAGYLSEVYKQYPEIIRSVISDIDSDMDSATEEMRMAMNAHMENAFINEDYKNIDKDMQSIASSIVGEIDSGVIAELNESGGEDAVIAYVDDILSAIDNMGFDAQKKLKSAFDLENSFNNGDINFGEYKKQIDEIESTIDRLDVDTKVKDQLKKSLNIDDVKNEYHSLVERFEELGVEGADSFAKGLSSTELSVAYDVIADIGDAKIDGNELKKKIEDAAKLQEAMSFTINIEGETEGLEAFNTALSESRSATGLTIESMDALKNRYESLPIYDAARLFEETANGISLNAEAVNEYEQALADTKLDETNDHLDTLKDRYDELTKEINDCSNAADKSKLINEQEEIRQQISDLAELATAYEGLTSSYAEWQNAESAGNDRDLYANVQSAMEGIGKELENGWIDDGTREYFQLIWGEDKWDSAGKSVQDYRNKWDTLNDTIAGTSYSIQDFFKTNKDGELTSEGIFNFFDAVDQVEDKIGKDVVKKDKNGNIISFDFGVDGDKAVADALGISEELVQIFLRASQDAGFVVSFDGTYSQLADLQNEAKAAQNAFNEAFGKNYSFNFDTRSLKEAQDDLEEAKKLLENEDFWNHDANGKRTTFNYDAKGATEAMKMVSTLQAMVDNLNNSYIGITVEDKQFEEPLKKAQDYESTVAQLNQLKLDPKANTADIETLKENISEIIDYFAELDDETKKELKIPVDLEGEALDNKIKEMLDNGSLEIPTTLDIQTNMNESIEDLRDLALLNSGILSEDQAAEIEAKFKVKLENEDIEKQVSEVLENVGITDSKESEIGIKFFADTQDIQNYKPEQIETIVKFIKDVDDIESYTPEDKQAVAEFIKDVDDVENYTPEQKEAIAKYVKDTRDIESYTPENKQVICDFIVNNEEVMAYTPEEKVAIAKYLADPQDIDSYEPEDKKAITKFIAEHGDVDAYNPADRQALATFLLDNALVEGYQPTDKDLAVIAEVDKSNVDNYQPKDKTMTVWATIKKVGSDLWNAVTGKGSVDGTAHVNGTAYANGTIGRAFKQGAWDTKDSGTALMGELGQETIVRDGRFFTVGDNGAEFVKYRKGDIIFNHKQTEELFKNGYVTSGGGRGRAYAEGTAFSNGTGSSKPSYGSWTASTSSSKKSKSKSSNSDSKAKEDAKEFEEVLDWIEVAIDRIERSIKNLDTVASSAFRSWSERTSALNEQIAQTRNEIDLQQRAYDRYMKAANEVGLDAGWAQKVRDGKVDIELITDENLKEKVDQYQDWYEKALNCRDAVIELTEKESELYKQRFDNVSAKFEGYLGVIEHEKNMLDEFIAQSEAHGWITSQKYYEALAQNTNNRISELKKQRDEMTAEMNAAVDSGKISKGSEAWYEMVNEIDSVTLELEKANTELLEFQNNIRDIDYQIFELIQDRISDITEEADFLIELMSNKKLYDDKGQLTDEGQATMGLHGVNYNTYMAQADKYKQKVDELNAQIAKDPHNQNLIDKRDEYLEAQRESILNAENEKEAIRDLIRDGIEAELDALSELIDKRNEALSNAKD